MAEPSPDSAREFPREIPAPEAYKGGKYTLAQDAGAAARGPVGSPVYISPTGERVVPSGTLFVQFAAGTRAEDRRADLERIGLRIVKAPGFAPHAAYVEGLSLAKTLLAAGKLQSFDGVQSVEVQMKREAERK